MDYFSIIFSQLNKSWGQFSRVWTKNAICRNFLRNFRKLSKVFKIIAKNALSQHNFQKFNKLCVNFLREWTKNTNCLEILRKFQKILKKFLKKIAKIVISESSIFSNKFSKKNKKKNKKFNISIEFSSKNFKIFVKISKQFVFFVHDEQ